MQNKKNPRFFLALTFLLILFVSCAPQSKNHAVIWTDQSEFALYAELFNISQSKYRITVVYKENPAQFLAQNSDEKPDIIIGAWLKNERTRKYFLPLDYLFNAFKLDKKIFYKQLLDLGYINNRHYLLPVSFNLPAVIFDKKNEDLIEDSNMLSLEQIRELGAQFNKKQKNGQFIAMGFAPGWDLDFLYLTAKLKNTDFQESKNYFTYNKNALADTIEYLRAWTITANENSTAEEDFKFKYLYNPVYKSVQTSQCLFGYIKTDILFNMPLERLHNIDFRWVQNNNVIQVNDKIINVGILRNSKNIRSAEAFIIWFMNEANQKEILSWISSIHLASPLFGISGGFSSLKSVNERVFPLFYPLLYGHLPQADLLRTPRILPSQWQTIKEKIILPYLHDSVTSTDSVKSVEERLADWVKQNN